MPETDSLFVHFDLKIQHLEIRLCSLGIERRGADLVLIWHYENSIPLLVSDECIKGKMFIVFFYATNMAAGKSEARTHGETCSCANRNEIIFERRRLFL